MPEEKELITIFQALTGLHEKFNVKAVEKMEAVKRGHMTALEKLMKEESVLIQQLRRLENTRQHAVDVWMREKGFVKEDVTMDVLLRFFSEENREELRQWQNRLVMEIGKLKEQNELNRQLIEESLRFVNISLDAMQPQQDFGNYSHPVREKGSDGYDGPGRSLFDSKV